MKFQSFLLFLLLGRSEAWMTPSSNSNFPIARTVATSTARNGFSTEDKMLAMEQDYKTSASVGSGSDLGAMSAAVFVSLAAFAASPDTASAAESAATVSSTIVTAGGPVSSALFAYGHYISIFGIVGILFTERWTLENGPNLTDDEENRLAIADTLYGIVAVFLLYTGYYRFSDPALGKGADFYIHEPVFWLKMTMLGVLGGAILFNTTKIIQRSVSRFTGNKTVEPMSEALCDRMKALCNAQLTGLVFIPMAATFMARGVGYNDSIPWQAEAGVALTIWVGLSFKYVKEALTFESRLAEKE